MTLLALPGRQPATFQPLADLLAALAEPESAIQRYGFWAGDYSDPDIEPEARIAAASSADCVVALSIGALVAISARRTHGLRPSACIFIGAPVKRLAGEGRLHLLAEQAAAVPTLFLQQARDPTGSFVELIAALPASAQTCELAGDDHAYANPATLAALIAAWPPWRLGR